MARSQMRSSAPAHALYFVRTSSDPIPALGAESSNRGVVSRATCLQDHQYGPERDLRRMVEDSARQNRRLPYPRCRSSAHRRSGISAQSHDRSTSGRKRNRRSRFAAGDQLTSIGVVRLDIRTSCPRVSPRATSATVTVTVLLRAEAAMLKRSRRQILRIRFDASTRRSACRPHLGPDRQCVKPGIGPGIDEVRRRLVDGPHGSSASQRGALDPVPKLNTAPKTRLSLRFSILG